MKLGDRYWRALPVAVRKALLMVIACLLFSITGGLIKLLGQRLDSLQIAFFASLRLCRDAAPRASQQGASRIPDDPSLWPFPARRGRVASMVAGFHATTRLPRTDSTAISF